MRISRFTYYLTIDGKRVLYNITNTHHWQSPLVQGGLEIPIQIAVTIELHKSTAPYDNKLPNACHWCKYMKCNTFLVMANNQLTINPKDGKKAFPGIPTWVHHRLPVLMLLHVLVSPLGKLPKRLGPQVQVNQEGLSVLQWWGQLFLAHTDKLCTRSHDVNVRAYLINFLFYSPISA